MILASVTTCPSRWKHYQRLRREFEGLQMSIALRTFQTSVGAGNPRINNNLNARSALTYARRHLPFERSSWLLYLEDDIRLDGRLSQFLRSLKDLDPDGEVRCWYLCNRRNPVSDQFRKGGYVINRLKYPIQGTHALLISPVLFADLLDAPWHRCADEVVFAALEEKRVQVWQVVEPVLIEHVGEHSTYDPKGKARMEINYANTSNIDQA